MKTKTYISAIIFFSLLFWLFAPALSSQAMPAQQIQAITLKPLTMLTQSGSTMGTLSSLRLKDQANTSDNPARYVLFKTPNRIYIGYRTYKLPQNSLRGALRSLKVLVNYKGPRRSSQAWTWYLFDWEKNLWVKAGDNTAVTTSAWTLLTLGASLANPARFVNPSTLEIRLRLVSGNSGGDAKIDYEAITVNYDFVPSRPYLQGMAYSPYRDCQEPGGASPTVAEVTQDLKIIAGMSNAVRTYSSVGINAQIPALARSLGLKVSAGAWLGPDKTVNEQEIEGLIQIAQTVDVDSVIVGNEVLLRGDLTEAELIGYIQRVKQAVTVPVTTAEIGSILLQHPPVMDAVDFQMVHLYPFWEGKSIEGAAQQVITDYHNIQGQANGKRVVIGETGWPSNGPSMGLAVPNPANQYRFAREFTTLAVRDNVEFFYFDIFDEMWKTQEHGVGQYWGLYRADRVPKYDFPSVMIPYTGSGLSYPVTTSFPQPDADTFYVYYNMYSYYDMSGSYGSGPAYLPVNHFSPSGWIGDISQINLNSCQRVGEWPGTMTAVTYTPTDTDPEGWAGTYWLNPEGNWGTVAPGAEPTNPTVGFDLGEYRQLVFRARADVPGTQVKFLVGGIAQDDLGNPLPYPSSVTQPLFAQEADPADGFVNLTSDWKEYHIDLTGANLQYVIDGFGWAAEKFRSPGNKIFYIDDIRYVKTDPAAAPLTPIHIYSGEFFRPGLDMGVNTSNGVTTWVTNMQGYMRASYPAGQSWGAVFITVGTPVPLGYRSSINLASHRYLTVEMRGQNGGETVSIGIKDKNQPDTGYETKKSVALTTAWKTYTFYLPDFTGADRTQIYVPIEFVFAGPAAQTIYFRNVQYLP